MNHSDWDWYFVVDSDTQYGRILDRDIPRFRREKENVVEQIININEKHDIDFVICCGNLTERGNWDELDRFSFDYVDRLERIYNTPLKLCLGNRDIKRRYAFFINGGPVVKYIKDRHSTTYKRFSPFRSGCYKFLHKGVLFICLGVYPKNIKWLKDNLPTDKKTPVIIFYHYNSLKCEFYSYCWSDKEKNLFFETIKNRNIKLIINGHLEISKICRWFDIPVINGSGKKLGLVHIKKLNNGDIFIKLDLV